jgi:Flp pilus assembly pilin Flp
VLNAFKLVAGYDDGQTTIEYLLVLVLIVIVIVLAVQAGLLSASVSTAVSKIANAIS